MEHNIVGVKPLKDYKIFIMFDNGVNKIYSCTLQNRGGLLTKLKDIEYFNNIYVDKESNAIAWKDSQDLASHDLYEVSKTTDLEFDISELILGKVYPEVEQIEEIYGYKLKLNMSSEETYIYDAEKKLDEEGLENLKDRNYFREAHVYVGTVVWGNREHLSKYEIYEDSVRI